MLNNKNTKKTPVYFIPGLAAGKEIFEYISLPEELYDVHIIEWIIPKKRETIRQYAMRMAALVNKPKPILIGVSFGGVMAQEMNEFLDLKKLIIISSIKSKNEIPTKMRIFKTIPAYRLIPSSFLENTKKLVRYGLGIKSKNKLQLYLSLIHISEPTRPY